MMNKIITKAISAVLLLALALTAFTGCASVNVPDASAECDAHLPGEWTVEKEATASENGIEYKECTLCSDIITMKETVATDELGQEYGDNSGITFPNASNSVEIEASGAVRTIEAMIQLSPDCMDRGGVVVGNYSYGGGELINLEIYYGGQVRLFYKSEGASYSYLFGEDIRSDKPVHIAVSVSGSRARLYVNGELSETVSIEGAFPAAVSDLRVGADNRGQGTPLFQGKIYSVSIFSDVRSGAEISKDAVAVAADAEGLLYSRVYETKYKEAEETVSGGIEITASSDISTGDMWAAPYTFEAIIKLAKSYSDKGGIIFGNLDDTSKDGVTFKIGANGKPMLAYRTGGVSYAVIFNADVRADGPVHVAVSVEGYIAKLYINGKLKDSVTLDAEIPYATDSYVIGNDKGIDRSENFKGILYGVAMLAGARSAKEIAADAIMLPDSGDTLLYSTYYRSVASESIAGGKSFDADGAIDVEVLTAAPKTFEALIKVPKDHAGRAGVIFGNYSMPAIGEQINFEVYYNGAPRLYYLTEDGVVYVTFKTDIRSDSPVHIAFTVEGRIAKLYVNGVLVESVGVAYELPAVTEGFKLGGDNRDGNVQYFKGEIYSVNVFSDVRDAEEIKADMAGIVGDEDGLVYSNTFYTVERTENVEMYRPAGQSGAFNNSMTGVIKTPGTIEATIELPEGLDGRGGVIVGNYAGGKNCGQQLNLEVYYGGRLRLFYVNNGEAVDHLFATSIPTGAPVNIAVSFDGSYAVLYINGSLVEYGRLSMELPETGREFMVGGDYRIGNDQYFKGVIYSVAMFDGERTKAQIASDAVCVSENADGLVYSAVYSADVCSPALESGKHIPSGWLTYREESGEVCGVKYKECTECGILLATRAVIGESGEPDEDDKTIDLSEIIFDDKIVNYNGKAHSIEVDGALPEGVNVTYIGNGKVNAGTYVVTARFSVTSSDYTIVGPTEKTAVLKINRATVNATVHSTEYIYACDGEAKTPNAVTFNTNIDGVSMVVIGGGQTLPGTYKVIYRFVIDPSLEGNVAPCADVEVTMTITKNKNGTEGLIYGENANGTYYVEGYNGTDSVVFIPETYNGKAVTAIAGRAFENKTFIKYISVPDSVLAIGHAAMRGCTSIEAITLPFIGGSAGSSNSYLGYIFGASGYVGNEQFVPASLKTVDISDACTLIPAYSFQGCANITEVRIGSGVKEIGSSAFRGCKSLKGIFLPENVALIRAAANNYNSPFYEISDDFVIYLGADSVPEEFASKWNVLNTSGKKAVVVTGKTYQEYLVEIG